MPDANGNFRLSMVVPELPWLKNKNPDLTIWEEARLAAMRKQAEQNKPRWAGTD